MSDDERDLPSEGIERRKFIKGAATVAWATPLILTTVAGNTGAAAASAAPCIAVGMQCNACTGMPCCDVDGAPDGGCCCSPQEVPVCNGVCVGMDSDCATPVTGPAPGGISLTLVCYVPAP